MTTSRVRQDGRLYSFSFPNPAKPMATDALSNLPLPAIPADCLPVVEHLVTEDDTPVDNVFSEKQQRLLTEPLFASWTAPEAAPGSGPRPFVAMANVGLFYAVARAPLVPDMLLSMDVELPENIHVKAHRSYFYWLYGKPPDVVIEVVPNNEGGEDREKLTKYARIGIPYYVVYDPDQLLSGEQFRVYALEATRYQRLREPTWFPDVGLGLRVWHGSYEGLNADWLRWVDATGGLVPTGHEGRETALEEAERERQRAQAAEERAESERRRAERLAEQLRQLGAEPRLD
jgi:hypothetical protein